VIKISDLNFRYDKSSSFILKNINLHIPKGVYLSVIGENGSCKTTLIKLILGLLSPVSGSIDLHASNISYVPQRVETFNSEFPITVYEILKTHAKALHLDVKSSVKDALQKVNMENFKNSLIGNLSGGQQQRIFIARALMGNPDLIVLDEPSTGVDIKNQREIYSLLSSFNKQHNTTIISIEHNIENALNYSTHILKVKDGRITLNTVDDFKENIHLEGA
jgi:zinc transport system ATP-binding protein